MNSNQIKTIESFKKIDNCLYSLVYHGDYSLDKALNSGISNTLQLLGFMIKETKKIGKVQSEDTFACTSFEAKTADGAHIMGRNFDYMEAPLIVVWTAPKEGYKSLTVANCTFMLFGKNNIWPMKEGAKKRLLFAPYCCMDGINEKGLAIAVLEIKTKATQQSNDDKKEFTTTLAIRAILDKCATCDEAVEEFKKYNMHDAIFCNYHFQITDANDDSVIIEYVNNEMRVIKKGEENQCLTNYFLSEGGDNEKGFGYERLEFVSNTIKENGGVISEDDAMKMLEYVHLNYKHRRGYQVISLWSSIYNSKEKSMDICTGLDYKKRYKVSVDKPGEFVEIGEAKTEVQDYNYKHFDDILV